MTNYIKLMQSAIEHSKNLFSVLKEISESERAAALAAAVSSKSLDNLVAISDLLHKALERACINAVSVDTVSEQSVTNEMHISESKTTDLDEYEIIDDPDDDFGMHDHLVAKAIEEYDKGNHYIVLIKRKELYLIDNIGATTIKLLPVVGYGKSKPRIQHKPVSFPITIIADKNIGFVNLKTSKEVWKLIEEYRDKKTSAKAVSGKSVKKVPVNKASSKPGTCTPQADISSSIACPQQTVKSTPDPNPLILKRESSSYKAVMEEGAIKVLDKGTGKLIEVSLDDSLANIKLP